MTNLWDADIHITAAEAAAVIESQFPELTTVQLQSLGTGWDNIAFLAGGIVFRFPRRHIATQLLETEVQVLPSLAPLLPLPIPNPHYVGLPTTAYPHLWAGYPYVPGETASQFHWTDAERTRNVPALAQFLATLHRIPVTPNAPEDTIGRANCVRWLPRIFDRLQKNANLLTEFDVEHLARLASESAQAPPFEGAKCWLHGDLYPRHLLMDSQRHLCGIIDWGDVHVGDPALDLSIAFTFLPPLARVVFRSEYGTIDDATWRRARFRALHYGAVLVDYAAATWDEALLRTGLAALGFASLED